MNVLVTGAGGQLGCSLRVLAAHGRATAFPAAGEPLRFVFTDVVDASEESVAMLRKLSGAGVDTSTRHLDITDLEAVRTLVRGEEIVAIVNCAAFTNVEAAETRAEAAELLNAKAPENLAVVMKETGGLLVHISTDYVFGAEPYNRPCRESQTCTPTGVYGMTKLHGEQAIRRIGCEHVILRTAWLYSEFGKNFVRTMLHLTATKPQLKVVFDQCGTPTYAGDLAGAILAILAHPVTGTYHYSNEGVCSWYDFARTIAEMADQVSPDGHGIHSACDIRPCHSDEFPSPVRRPAYSVLDKTLIKSTFGLSIPYWTDSLRRCISSLV